MTIQPLPLPSPQEPIVDSSGKVTPRWWQFLVPLFDRLRDTRVTQEEQGVEIEEVKNSVIDQGVTIEETNQVTISNVNSIASIQAAWAVEINGNGQLIGLVKLDSTDAYSTFTVVADKFLVANPTADGVKQVFVIAQVDGVPTVAIDGDLIADGTIQARSLVADTLSAISADLGVVTAGRMQSADGNFVIDLDNKTISITT